MDSTTRRKREAEKITVEGLMGAQETRFVLVGYILRDERMTRAQWLELPDAEKNAKMRARAESLIETLRERVGL